MALSDSSKILISIKKLVGKAHTSNDKDVANEGLPSGLTLASNTIFAQTIPVHTGSSAEYEILSNSLGEGVVEFLRFSASFIAGTDTSSGRHGFQLKLPDDYQTNSKNPKKGTYPFLNQQSVFITSGTLQLIPPSFDSDYEGKPYHTSGGETRIPVLDARDWSLDYFNGIFFQQDPPGTGDHAENPSYIDAYLYIGEFSDKGVFSSGMSGSLTKLTDGTSYLAAGDNVTISSSSNGQIIISSDNDDSTFPVFITSPSEAKINTTGSLSFAGALGSSHVPTSIGTDVFFFVSGAIGSKNTSVSGSSVFGGDVTASGSINALLGLTGSLTRLLDGTSYLAAGNDITITSASNGQIAVASTAQSQRKKFTYEVTASHASSNNLPIDTFNFTNVKQDSDRLDLYVNGQLMLSGTGNDYLVSSINTSINFSFDLEIGDIISIRTF